MARHIYVGAEAAATYTAGVLGAGAIDIQKMSANGPTTLNLADTVADAPQIRVVQGNGTTNIVSPWIYGKDIIDWSGKGYITQAAHTSTLFPTPGSSAAADKELEVKITRLDGTGPEFFKFNVTIPASTNQATAGAAIVTAFNALTTVPAWLSTAAGTTTVTFTGTLKGASQACTSCAGLAWDYAPAIFNVVVSVNPTTTQTYTAANGVIDGTPGYGGGEYVQDFEETLLGINYGYYNRIQQPVTPASTAVVGTNYDMWHLAATKDGSSSSQIHGVDNLIDITIANTTGSAANALLTEQKLNGYCASVGFATVTL
jgi:hypothetical protein